MDIRFRIYELHLAYSLLTANPGPFAHSVDQILEKTKEEKKKKTGKGNQAMAEIGKEV